MSSSIIKITEKIKGLLEMIEESEFDYFALNVSMVGEVVKLEIKVGEDNVCRASN